MSILPKVVLVDPDARGRLRLVAALHDHFEVVVPEEGEELVRAVRRYRPQVVVLAMPRGRLNAASRECRTIKTDGRDPPAVGLTDRWCRVADPKATLSTCMGDGYLGGQVEAAEIRRWVRQLADGKSPVVVLGEAETTLLSRFWPRKS